MRKRCSRENVVILARQPPDQIGYMWQGQESGPEPVAEKFGGNMPSITNILRLFVALAMAMIAVPLLLSSSASAAPGDKVVVCKYSHTPVVNEQAQTVIIVSQNALDGTGFAGLFPFTFSDQQNTSIATRFAEEGEQSNELVIGDECPPFQPTDECEELPGDQPEGFQCEALSETETQDLGPLLDCDAGTLTTLHQERSRTQTFNAETQEWEWGAFSEWETVDTTVVDATEEDCPVDNPPNPPEPIVDPPVNNPPSETPTLPNTGSSPYLTALALMGGLLMTAGSAVFLRSRKVRVPRA
jgi:LPXTG-motif cell wall-anchored protein